VPARAIPIEDEPTLRRILAVLVEKWGRLRQLEAFLERSPLIEVELGEDSLAGPSGWPRTLAAAPDPRMGQAPRYPQPGGRRTRHAL